MNKKLKYYYNRVLPAIKTVAIRKGLYPGDNNYQKFVVIGTARVGSTLLQAYLNQHPNIFCEGEIYNTDHLKIYGKKDKLLRKLKETPVQFVEEFGFPKHEKKIQSAGFKLFYEHFRDKKTKKVWDFLSEKKDLKIIHLKRENVLRSLVSLKIAYKTNKWRSFEQKEDENKQVILTKEECLERFNFLDQNELFVDKTFNKQSVYKLKYKDLVKKRQKTMAEIFTFLSTEIIEVEEPALKRQNPEALHQLIANFEELKDEFKNSPYIKHFKE